MPKARTILVNGAVRKGERLVPPFAFEILMGATFPAPSARVKVITEGGTLYKESYLPVTQLQYDVLYRLLKGSRLYIQP